MRDQGLGSWPGRLARRSPDAPALVFDGEVTTSAGLLAGTEALSAGLHARGIGRGDRVAFLGGNQPAFLLALFACGRLGAVFVALNTRLAAPELAYQLADSGSSLLLYDAERTGLAQAAAQDSAASLVEVGAGDWEALSTRAATEVPDLDVGHDDPALLMYTSGTTGVPKGVVLTHGNLTWNALNVVVDVDLHADEVALIVSPLFHAAALCMNSLPVLLKGGTLVLAGSAAPGEMLRLIAAHAVTHLQGVPTIYQMLADDPGWADADLSRLRRAISGGAAAGEELIRTYLDRGVPFGQGYGMTETGPGASFLPARSVADKIGSVGVPMFFTDVRVVDELGGDASAGQPGEVLVSGPNVSAGYWRRDGATRDATVEGWYRSGDLAIVDEDGHLSIVDRVKDMFVSGGENVYPAQVEAVLGAHPEIAECAVVPVPDTRWGEVGLAFVVPTAGSAPDPRELLGFLDGKLARYKIPKSVRLVDELPHTAYGKVRKAELRAGLTADSGPSAPPAAVPIPAPEATPAPTTQESR